VRDNINYPQRVLEYLTLRKEVENYSMQLKGNFMMLDKNVKSTVPVWGDCKETLPLLTGVIDQKVYPQWLQQFKDFQQKEEEKVIKDELNPAGEVLSMGEIIKELNILTKGDAIIVTDVGQHQMVACRYAKFNKTKSNITSGGLGTMGFALPAAIGAAFGDSSRPTVAIIGDGGFQMTLQELGTIMQFKPNVKIIILNNQFLGMVRQWQQLFHEKRYSFVDITSPDFVQVAKGFGISGKSISKREDVVNSLKEMLDHDGSFLLEIMVGKENNVFPMVPQGRGVAEIILSKDEL